MQYVSAKESERALYERLDRLNDMVTGGDAYPRVDVLFEDPPVVMLHHDDLTENPLYDVVARVWDLRDADRAGAQLLKAQQSGVRISTLELVQGIGTTTLVGTLPPHGSVILPMKLEPTSEKLDLAAQIGSRVGFFSQRLIFRRVGGRWCRATRIVRGGNNSERILLEKVDPDFPQGEWPAH